VNRGKFWEVIGEGIGRGRSKKARLSHPSTKALPEPARASNELLSPNQTRTDGGTWKWTARYVTYAFRHVIVLTESLAETGADGVEGLTKHVERRAGLYGSMPDTRTVEVHLDAALVRVRRDANYFVLWKYRPTKGIL
jgi:hypothetical protein